MTKEATFTVGQRVLIKQLVGDKFFGNVVDAVGRQGNIYRIFPQEEFPFEVDVDGLGLLIFLPEEIEDYRSTSPLDK